MHYSGHIGTEGKVAMVPGTASVFTLSARIKMPKTSGNFASLWTRTVSGGGPPQEIDVIESFGVRAACRLKTNYYPTYDPGAPVRQVCLDGRRGVPAKPWAGFHTYTAVWRPGVSMTIKIDGRRVHEFKEANTPTLPQFVILSNLINDRARSAARSRAVPLASPGSAGRAASSARALHPRNRLPYDAVLRYS